MLQENLVANQTKSIWPITLKGKVPKTPQGGARCEKWKGETLLTIFLFGGCRPTLNFFEGGSRDGRSKNGRGVLMNLWHFLGVYYHVLQNLKGMV